MKTSAIFVTFQNFKRKIIIPNKLTLYGHCQTDKLISKEKRKEKKDKDSASRGKVAEKITKLKEVRKHKQEGERYCTTHRLLRKRRSNKETEKGKLLSRFLYFRCFFERSSSTVQVFLKFIF